MQTKKAFTLIEVLIVVAILALLILGSMYGLTQQRQRAEDLRIKTYLSRLKIAFEDYYNDHNCFPPETWFDDQADCGSPALSPYINVLECDKKTGRPYTYETDNTSCHQWFKLYATFALPDRDVQAIALRTTDPLLGSTKGNYGISSSGTQVYIYHTALASSAPSSAPTAPPPGHNYYWCSAQNNCTANFDTSRVCTPMFLDDANCGGTNYSKCPVEDIGTCIPL